MKFTAVSFIVLSLAAVASAVPQRFGRKASPVVAPAVADRSTSNLDTNAKRLAAGLPPLPARKLWSPTESAKRWNTSPVPHVGKVGIKAKNGTELGFISRFLNVNGAYTLDLDEQKAATIYFGASNVGKSPKISLRDQTSNSTNATFFGAVIPKTFFLVSHVTSTPTIPGILKRQDAPAGTQNQTDHVTIAGVAQTAPDSTPQDVPNTIQGSSSGDGSGSSGGGDGAPVGSGGNSTIGVAQDGESAIWTYDPNTQSWTASWTNYDGSAADASPYYNPSTAANASSIALVSDTQTYLAANPQAVEIDMSFVV